MGKRYKTGTVARRVGISPTLLRTWETRHAILVPLRGPGGQRTYSEDDVEFLEALKVLVGDGLSIGELATWSRDAVVAARGDRHAALASSGARHPSAILSVDAEGVIVLASPTIESLLGWPYGMLVGAPIWGLLASAPPALERAITGISRSEVVVSTWLRTRQGTLTPCRLACGKRRRTSEGTVLTISVTSRAARRAEGDASLEATEGPSLQLPAAKFWKASVEQAVDGDDAALARVWTYDKRDGTLHLVASAGLSKAVSTSARAVITLARYPYKVGAVARSWIPYVHNDLKADRDFDREWVTRERLESAAVLPLVCRGELHGVMARFFRTRLDSAAIGRVQAHASQCEAKLARRG